ncbi:hypothetical protein MKZ24_18265 [Paenibacillus sp. FSL R7-0297]|uniref:hypothetical protein n=1 Tax=unclassified Paenibacillus TaxID=185978 RepID=UPI0030F5C931
MVRIVLTLMTLLFSLTGCSASHSATTLDHNATAAKDYLESKGYKVSSYEGSSEVYTLTKEKLMNLPYSNYWGLQTEDPSVYLDKEVNVQKFIVTNHPLDNWKSTSAKPENIVKSKGKTAIWIYVVDNQAVGGHSYPVIDQAMDGGVWSLDGRTLEEVHSMSYKAWLEQWEAKFGS